MVMISDVQEPVAVLLSETGSSSESSGSANTQSYTFTDTTDYYTPWGTAPMDAGLSYFKIGLGAVGVVAVFCFGVPYAISLITRLVSDFRNNFKG